MNFKSKVCNVNVINVIIFYVLFEIWQKNLDTDPYLVLRVFSGNLSNLVIGDESSTFHLLCPYINYKNKNIVIERYYKVNTKSQILVNKFAWLNVVKSQFYLNLVLQIMNIEQSMIHFCLFLII